MNNITNKLESVSFFNSALFKKTKIDLDGNIFISGRNGSGKTTVLRAVCFFNTGNQKALMKEDRDFYDYFFEYGNSFIVFVFAKQEHDVIVTMFAKEDIKKVLFRFSVVKKNDYSIEDIFYKSSRKDALNALREVEVNHHEVSNAKEYLRVLYGQSKKEYLMFSMASIKNYQNLANLLYSVFKNNTIESKSVKNIILDHLKSKNEGDMEIDLVKQEKKIKFFEYQYSAITEWKKHSHTIEKIAEDFQIIESEDYKKRGKLETIAKSLQYHQHVIPILEVEESKQKALKEQTEGEIEENTGLQGKAEQWLTGKVVESNTNIENLETQYKDFHSNYDIQKITQEIPKKKSYEAEKLSNEAILKKLLDSQGDLRERNEGLVGEINELSKRQKDGLNLKFEQDSKKVLANKIKIDSEIAVEIGQIEKKYTDIKTLETSLPEADSRLQKLEYEHKMLIDKAYENDVVAKDFFTKVEAHANKIESLNSKITSFENDKKVLSQNEDSFIESHNKDKHSDFNKCTEEANDIQKKIDTLRGIVSSDGTLYSQLVEHDLDVNKYLSLLKDDVLISSDFSLLREGGRGQNTIFDFAISENSDLFLDNKSINSKIAVLVDEKKDVIKKRSDSVSLYKRKYEEFYKDHNAQYKKIQEENQNLGVEIKKIENSLLRIQEQANAYKVNWKQSYQDELVASQSNIEERKSDYKTNKIRLEELIALRESEINRIKSRTINEEEIIKKLEIKLNETILEIEEKEKVSLLQRNEAYAKELEQGGVSPEEVIRAEKACKEVDANLLFITENIKIEEAYNTFLKEKYILVDRYKRESAEFSKELDTSNAKYKIELGKLSTALSSIDEKLNKVSAQLQVSQKERDNIEKYLEQLDEEDYKTIKDCAVVKVNKEEVVEIFELTNQLLIIQKAIKKAKDNIGVIVNEHWGVFISKGYCEFEGRDSLAHAKELIVLENNNWVKGFTDTTYEHIDITIDVITGQYNKIYDSLSSAKNQIRKINKHIEDIKTIDLIEQIELGIEERESNIVILMKKLTEYWSEHKDDVEKNLFGDPSKYDENHKSIIMDILLEFLRALDGLSKKDKKLSTGDLFDLKFHVIEKENDSGWTYNISEAGSEGTSIIVKIAVNAALIKIASESSSNYQAHISVDEIGKIHNDYVIKVIEYINSKNAKIIGVQPNMGMDKYFNKAYIFDAISAKETRVKNHLRKKLELKGVV